MQTECRQIPPSWGCGVLMSGQPRLLPSALDAEGIDQIVQMRTRDIEASRRLDDVPAALLEGFSHQLRLIAPGSLLESTRCLAIFDPIRRVRKDVSRLDLHRTFAGRPDAGRLDGMLELSHVPGPFGRLDRAPGAWRETDVG